MRSHSQRNGWQVALTMIVLLIAAGIAYLLLESGPKVLPDDETPVAKMVKVRKILPDRYPIFISAYGTVIPARRLTIEPEVTGLVTRQHQSPTP